MKKIVAIGEIVVEILATEKGQSFRSPGFLNGPFPSGAPAIFIDQVAKLGQPCGLISCVGNDDFGWLNIERLKQDGVDVSAIKVQNEFPTGTAFVRYHEDGNRDFIFNIKHSASGQISLTDEAVKLLDSAAHVHVMGSSLFSFRSIDTIKKSIEHIKKKGGTVSFDPNIRKEMLSIPEMREALEFMLEYCDVFLPSGAEISLLTQAKDEEQAIREILNMGVSSIIMKRGEQGAEYIDAKQRISVPAFKVKEIDPTGAGDCFGATYITCWLQGMSVEESLRYASASGAHTVTCKGPMEGATNFKELNEFINQAKIS